MATRDRTGLFLSFRAACGHEGVRRGGGGINARFSRDFHRDQLDDLDEEDRQGLLSKSGAGNGIGPAGDAVIEMDTLPPRWLDLQEDIEEGLGKIQKLTAKLEPLHKKHALPGFEDRTREEREIERLTNEITAWFKKCNDQVKAIEAQGEASTRDVDRTMARNVTQAMAQRVAGENAKFRKSQAAYLARLKRTPVFGNASADASRVALDEESQFGGSSSGDQQQQSTQARVRRSKHDSQIREREKEIDEIARSITDVADIFKELQTMVIDQGTVVDRIDYNIEVMHTETKAAVKELNQASDLQKRTRKRKLMLLLVLLIVGCILVIIYKPIARGTAHASPLPKPGESIQQPTAPIIDAGP